MLDARPTHAHPPPVIKREDYQPPEWLVPEIALEFELDGERTMVRSTMTVEREGDHKLPLRLDAGNLALRRVAVDGEPVNYWYEHDVLKLPVEGDRATVETEVEIHPRANTQLMGLYESGGMLCTQCEAQGFRRITPFPDRPDEIGRASCRERV